MVKTITINQLGNAIAREGKRGKYIFWLGAGTSATAGVPLAEGIVDRLLDREWRELGNVGEPYATLSPGERDQRRAEVRKWAQQTERVPSQLQGEDWGTLYSHCLKNLPGQVDRSIFIDDCLKETGPQLNFAAILMAQLIRAGFVRTVLTTNFDSLVEGALQLLSENAAVRTPNDIGQLRIDPTFPQIAYLHGKEKAYDLRNTDDEVRENIPGFTRFLEPALTSEVLVVVGYRGGDEWPMNRLEQLLTRPGRLAGRALYWVSHEKESEYERLSPALRRVLDLPETRWLPGLDADKFFVELCACQGIGLGIPRDQTFETRLPPSLARRYSEDYKEPDSTRFLRLRGSTGPAFKDAYSRSQGDLARAYSDFHEAYLQARGDRATDYEVHFNYGVGLMVTRRYLPALKKFEFVTGVDPKDVEAPSLKPEALSLKGDLLQKSGRYEEAMGAYRQSASSRESAPCLNNWGVALHNLRRYTEAKEKFEQALELEAAYREAKRNWFAAERKLAGAIEDKEAQKAKLAEIADREREESESDPDFGFTGAVFEERQRR
ncbi:MAG TPA: tetratricopeptide repeat protein [Terriglobia bacterium]|nr:tetratricopeptide repeat protein [Terriglobia bacterium]